MASPDPNVPYAVQEVADWDPAGFAVRRDEHGVTITGACPSCGHAVDKSLRATGVFGFGRAAEQADPDEDVIRCNCAHAHEGGTAGQGCGRYWGIEISRG